jgi:hypothetical protein
MWADERKAANRSVLCADGAGDRSRPRQLLTLTGRPLLFNTSTQAR